MRAKIRELRQKRAQLIAQARAILDQADEEDRGLTEEEQNQYDAIMDDVNDMAADIERREQQLELEQRLQESVQEPNKPDPESEQEQRAAEFQREQRVALNRFLRDPDSPNRLQLRALQADADIYGGYLVTPVQFVQDLIQAVDNLVYIRQWATTHQVATAASLGAPSLDNDPADPTWTAELAIGSEDSTMSFGKRELYPHPLAKYIKVSRKLLRMVPDVESLVRDRLGYKFSVTMENAYLNGSGSNQPLGVFVASDDGIGTARDASTGNTSTEIRFDGLIEAKYTLKPQYWPKARWMFHRDGVKQIAKLKDGEGQYIWRESVRVGEPDRILGFPSFMSEYAPNTFTASQYVGILGDFAFYWIADALDMDMQRLDELYAATNQVGFVGRMESDGMPVLAEAFVRVKLAAS
jgi:HK97 family phage major capsid protein